MFGALGKAFGAAKDKAFEASGKAFLNRKIESFGTVTRLQIDSARKTVLLEVELKGEISPITIQVHEYELRQRNGESFVLLKRVDASREWMGIALNQYLVGQEIKIPNGLKLGL